MARRTFTIAGLIVVMAATLAAGLLLVGRKPPAGTAWGAAPPAVQAVMWPEPRPLADVTLSTQHGETFTTADLEDRWSLMFFGYLDCPDVCPTSLHAMKSMREHLTARSAGTDLRMVFVSVDPSDDDPEEMAEYLAWYDPEFIGLRGAEAEIARLAESMAVKYVEFVDEAGYRSIDHTSSVMIVDPSGRMVGALPPPLVPERMAERFLALRSYLETSS